MNIINLLSLVLSLVCNVCSAWVAVSSHLLPHSTLIIPTRCKKSQQLARDLFRSTSLISQAHNNAIVFMKPHAQHSVTTVCVRDMLKSAGCTIQDEFDVYSKQIKDECLIDSHYGIIAKMANVNPSLHIVDLLDKDMRAKFEEHFNLSWTEAHVVSNEEALDIIEKQSGTEMWSEETCVETLKNMWRDGGCLKLKAGCYISRLVDERFPRLPKNIFTLNGFYPAMKQEFIADHAKVHVFDILFDESKLSWSNFRSKVIGATDPIQAIKGSIRNYLLKHWSEVKLDKCPNMNMNCVHASAGPVEGLKEKLLWRQRNSSDLSPSNPKSGTHHPYNSSREAIKSSGRSSVELAVTTRVSFVPFASRLIEEGGVDELTVSKWLTENPVVELMDGTVGRVFDITEGLDSSQVVNMAKQLRRSQEYFPSKTSIPKELPL